MFLFVKHLLFHHYTEVVILVPRHMSNTQKVSPGLCALTEGLSEKKANYHVSDTNILVHSIFSLTENQISMDAIQDSV